MATGGFVPAALTSRPWVNLDQWTDQLKRLEPERESGMRYMKPLPRRQLETGFACDFVIAT